MGTRDLEKEVPNLKRNLENSHDPLTNLKTEHSSLKIYSHVTWNKNSEAWESHWPEGLKNSQNEQGNL